MDLIGGLDLTHILAIALVVIVAGVVKGAVGFGFPLVAAPLLSNIWDVRHAVLLLALAQFTNNVGIVFSLGARGWPPARRPAALRRPWAGLVVGTVGGALLLATLDPNLLSAVVGGASWPSPSSRS